MLMSSGGCPEGQTAGKWIRFQWRQLSGHNRLKRNFESKFYILRTCTHYVKFNSVGIIYFLIRLPALTKLKSISQYK